VYTSPILRSSTLLPHRHPHLQRALEVVSDQISTDDATPPLIRVTAGLGYTRTTQTKRERRGGEGKVSYGG